MNAVREGSKGGEQIFQGSLGRRGSIAKDGLEILGHSGAGMQDVFVVFFGTDSCVCLVNRSPFCSASRFSY